MSLDRCKRMLIVLGLTLGGLAHAAVARTDTTFTYQGELTDTGAPANGSYNIDISLWDALSGGGQIGSTIMFNSLPVTDGRFTVELDFGADAFNNGDRWLQISVNGTELSPRQPVTRSPYSIQTRGIYVDAGYNVGIGTTSPEGPLHVQEGSAGSVTANANSSAVFERSAANYLSILSPDNTERGLLFGDPTSAAHGGILFDSAAAPDGLVFRAGGNVDRMRINYQGDVIVEQQLGVGDPSSLPGQLTIADSGAGALFSISADSSNATYPTIFASNATGPALWAWGASDASLSGGGAIVVDSETGFNLAIDHDEIMARNNGSPSTLRLNAQGGSVNMGEYNIHPALAYAKIDIGGTVVSASQNISTITYYPPGAYTIEIAGGVSDSDIVLVTTNNALVNASGEVDVGNNHYNIVTRSIDTLAFTDSDFQFVIYRP